MKVHNREVVFKALSGSINRNLNDNLSDRDVKMFVLPTLEDLYSSTVYKNFQTSDIEDIEIHDFRKLEKLLFNSNLTFLELLYSVEVDTCGYEEIEELIRMRDNISRINIRSLFNSCIGMYRGQMKDLTNPNSKIQEVIINKYGYNTKKAMMSLHFLKFIIKFYETDFTDTSGSIRYEGKNRDYMLDIKHGAFSLEEFKTIAHSTEEIALYLESEYFKFPINNETNNILKELLHNLFRNSLNRL